MEEVLLPLRELRYLDRPAFVALLGCTFGLCAFEGGAVLLGSLVLAILGGLLALCHWSLRKYSKYGAMAFVYPTLLPFSVACAIGAGFALYAAERAHIAFLFPQEISFPSQSLEILYPVAAHASSPLQYEAKVRYNGKEIKVLLRPKDGKPLSVEYGVMLTADVTLSSLMTGSSYHRYLLSEGYQARGFFIPKSVPEKIPNASLEVRLRELRENVVRSFVNLSRGQMTSPAQGLVAALSLGDRSRLDKGSRDDFSGAGVAHIMAVSGYHLGIVFLILGSVLKRVLWAHRLRHLRYAVLFVGILLYTLLSGASTATVRAFVMCALSLIALMSGRRTDVVQLLSLTVVLFLVAQPLSYLSVGLMLSLGAVWGILAFLPLVRRLFRPSISLLAGFRDAFFVTLCAQIALIPLLFFYFQEIRLSVFWSNIPLVLLSAILIPYGIFAIFLSPLIGAWIPGLLYSPLGWLAERMLEIIHYFGGGDFSPAVRGEWALFMVVTYYVALALFQKIAVRALNRRMSYPA